MFVAPVYIVICRAVCSTIYPLGSLHVDSLGILGWTESYSELRPDPAYSHQFSALQHGSICWRSARRMPSGWARQQVSLNSPNLDPLMETHRAIGQRLPPDVGKHPRPNRG